MKQVLFLSILTVIISCKKESTDPEQKVTPGRYSGTISGSFYPSNFPASGQVPFTDAATFEIVVGEEDGFVVGFDSVATKFITDKNSPSAFNIYDVRDGGDLRVRASGECRKDTLEMTGSYNFPDRSKQSFRFIGVKE